MAADPKLVALRDKMTVIGGFEDEAGIMSAKLVIKTKTETLEFYRHTGHANDDLADQQERLEAKYDALATPVLGVAAEPLKQAVKSIRQAPHVHELMHLSVPA